MTGFSLSAFRDFCAAKPEEERYGYVFDTAMHPLDAFDIDADDRGSDYLAADDAVFFKPRTYGALTARLDALIEGEKT